MSSGPYLGMPDAYAIEWLTFTGERQSPVIYIAGVECRATTADLSLAKTWPMAIEPLDIIAEWPDEAKKRARVVPVKVKSK